MSYKWGQIRPSQHHATAHPVGPEQTALLGPNQIVTASGGESFGKHSRQVDILNSGHHVDFFARVTLDGLSKNHAMTFNHSATTRR